MYNYEKYSDLKAGWKKLFTRPDTLQILKM